jgi:hypothetical protein
VRYDAEICKDVLLPQMQMIVTGEPLREAKADQASLEGIRQVS